MALSIDDLRSFIIVASERSVTRAAAKLGVSQQSVSERIRRLEARLGVQLFDRVAFGMQPTTAGFRLFPYASQAVALVEQALVVVDDDDHLRVRVQASVSTAVVPFLQNLASASSIELSTGDDAANVLRALVDGGADVAVGVFTASDISKLASNGSSSGNGHGDGELSPSSIGIVAEEVFTDPVVWVAPPEHPLAKREGSISLMELGTLPVGLPVSGMSGESTDGDLGGLRVAAHSVVASELASGQLVELAVEQSGWVVPVSIAFRATDRDRPTVQMVRKVIAEGHALASARKPGSPQL